MDVMPIYIVAREVEALLLHPHYMRVISAESDSKIFAFN
jgi:hypothetical protein